MIMVRLLDTTYDTRMFEVLPVCLVERYFNIEFRNVCDWSVSVKSLLQKYIDNSLKL